MSSSKPASGSYTYEQAGVSIDAGNALVKAIGPLVKATARPGANSEIGGFGGFFDPRAAGYNDPLLVAANDGVGTKVKLAIEYDRHDAIGIDLVAMCVNDLIVQGAEPLFFLDYFATGKLVGGVAERVIAGIAEGCRIAHCALIGGETAEMPGMYSAGDYDLAGFCVGAVERGQQLTGEKVAPGHALLGLASSGVHSNGYSLVRRLADDLGWTMQEPAPFDPERLLIEALIEPTRIYVQSLLPTVRSGRIDALAHITGGGLLENIPRVLPEGAHALIDAGQWKQPVLMKFLRQQGNIAPGEMARTFNCGIGMVLAVAPGEVKTVAAELTERGERVFRIGEIVAGANAAARCAARKARGAALKAGKRCTMAEQARVAVLISGSGTNMAALLYASRIEAAAYQVVLVASNDPGAAGLKLAEAEGIPTFALSHKGMARGAHDAAMDEAIRKAGASHVALAGYMRVLGEALVRRWEGRMLNIHPSLLPKYKGLDTPCPRARSRRQPCGRFGPSCQRRTRCGRSARAGGGGDPPRRHARNAGEARADRRAPALSARAVGLRLAHPQSRVADRTGARTGAGAGGKRRDPVARHALLRGQRRQEVRLCLERPPRRRQGRAAGQDQRRRGTGDADRARRRALLPPGLFRRRLGSASGSTSATPTGTRSPSGSNGAGGFRRRSG